MEDQKKKTTIKDVAAMANTSKTTVSRVLSGSNYPVREKLKKAVLDAAKELNYKPNVFGQLLRGGTSRQLGIVLPSVATPFYSQLITAVQKECVDNDYMPIIYSSYNDLDMVHSYIDALIHSQVAGALLSVLHWDESIGKRLDEADIPYVLFDQPHIEHKGYSIDFDFYSAGRMAADYLVKEGHKKNAFATGPLDRPSRKLLLQGFQDELASRKLTFGDDQLLVCNVVNQTGARPMKDYQCGQRLGKMILSLEDMPEALFAVNDMMAIGIMKELAENNVEVPSDISVLGFDNVEFCEMVVPALSTISQSAYKTGELATRLLCDCLNKKVNEKVKDNKKILLEPLLIERDSVKKNI